MKILIRGCFFLSLLAILSTCKKEKDPNPATDYIIYSNGEGIIGAGGGKITFNDQNSPINGVIMDIPPRSLQRDIKVSIQLDKSKHPASDSSATIINLLPDGLVFNKPIEITIPFKNISNPKLFYFSPDSDAIEQINVTEIDINKGYLKAELDHFSRYFVTDDPHGTFDAFLYRTPSGLKANVQFGGLDYDQITLAMIPVKLFFVLPCGYVTALDHINYCAANWGTDPNAYHAHLSVALKEDRSTLKTIEYEIRRIGPTPSNLTVRINQLSPNKKTFYVSGKQDSKTREAFFSGKALIFDFGIQPVSGKKYYLELTWRLAEDPTIEVNITTKYTLNTYNKYDPWTTSNFLTTDPDKNGNLIEDSYDIITPVAGFIANLTSITAGGSVTFTDQSTNNPTSWSWNFGDGTSSTNQNPSHTYSTAGTYSVTLTATNSSGSDTKTSTNYISVSSSGSKPVSNFIANQTTISAGGSVTFTDQSTNSPTSWSWSFGDGTSSTSQSPSHIYATIGTYTVTLNATNNFGSDTKTLPNYITVTSTGVKPVANFIANQTTIAVGGTVNFTDQSTNSPISWLWNFGDGTNSTNQNPSHTYATAGTFTVILTATNSYGSDTKTSANYITVNPVSGGGIIFNPNLTYGSVSDIDGNSYKTIQIGTQTWMAENLKTTLYNDNTAIPLVINTDAWRVSSTPAYCWYNNDEVTYKDTYGALYNWYTVSSVDNGNKNVCPTGWHVPTDAEWTTLTTYLGGETVAGGKLKETGIEHWLSPNTGATNETGFTALPSGSRNSNGPFVAIGNGVDWWGVTEESTIYAFNRYMSYGFSSVYRNAFYKQCGFSVRCIKDN